MKKNSTQISDSDLLKRWSDLFQAKLEKERKEYDRFRINNNPAVVIRMNHKKQSA